MRPAAVPPPLTLPIRRLRATLRAGVEAVEEGGARVVLTRHGRPVAALVPVGALDALDLLARLLPTAEEVAAGPRDHQGEGAGDETSPDPATNGALEVSVPSPAERAGLQTPGGRP